MGESQAGNRQPRWLREAILAGQPFHYRTKSPLAHSLRNLTALALLLGSIVGLVIWGRYAHPAYYVPVAACAFGLLYFGTFVLVVHEASHGMFVLTGNRDLDKKLNRAFGWAVAVCFATHYGKHWEHGHLEHHVRPMEPGDPQSHNTLTGHALLLRVLGSVFVPGFLFLDRTVLRAKKKGGKSSSSTWVILAFVAIWATLLTLMGWLYGWPIPLALFLGIHVLSGLNHVKGSLEHGGEIAREANPFLRSRTTLFLGRRLLMPFNISLHFEHHLNFSVPWYDLPRYHRALAKIVPPEIWAEMVNDQPLEQLTGKLGGLSDRARALST